MECPIHLNTQAISRLQCGSMEEAAGCLRRALAALRRVEAAADGNVSFNRSTTPSMPNTGNMDRSCSQSRDDAKNLQLQAAIATISIATSSCGTGINESPIQMFQRAIVISDCSGMTIELISAVVLYNFALVHHLKAVEDHQCPEEKKLMTALQLYEMALGLTNSEATEIALGASILPMAIENNIAHLQYLRFRFSEAQQSLEEVHLMLSEGRSLLLDVDDYALLFLNVIFLQEKRVIATCAPMA